MEEREEDLFFFLSWGALLPSQQWRVGRRRKTEIFIYMQIGGRWADEPPLQMILLGAAHPLSHP